MLFPLFLTGLLLSTASAIFPISGNRFLQGDASYKVPSADIDFTSSSYSSSYSTSINKNTYTNTSSSSSTTILNLIPGISLLQTDNNSECYYVNTIIGKTEYPLIIDTGSAYLWVYGQECQDPPCLLNKVYSFDTSESSSSSELDEPTSTFALAYVTGSAIGEVVEDNIIVNKLATTQSFKFGMAKTVPEFFVKYPVSGIFGLPSNDSSSIESIISALYDSHAISIKRFSILIGEVNENDDNYPNAGIFAIGEPVKELYIDEIHNVPLIQNTANYWLILINEIKINDSIQVVFSNFTTVAVDNAQQDSNVIRQAIVDSGTTVLALPKQDAIDLHSYFEDSVTDGTNFAILCNSTVTISLNLNGQTFSIVPEYYLGDAYAEDSGYDGYCVSNIQGIDSKVWILGAVFLKSVYVDFNVEEQQIGFAKRNTDVILTSTSTSLSATETIETSTIDSSTTGASSSSSTFSSANGAVDNFDSKFSLFSIISSIITILLL